MSQSTTAVREPLLRIAKREGTTLPQKILVRAVAILLALVVDALFIFFVTGLNPLAVYGVMWGGTFANMTRFSWMLRDLSILLCVGIALAPAFKMRFWNCGGEGQILIGGLIAALVMVYQGNNLPAPALFAAMAIGSMAAGALWGFVPAWFKSRWGTNETLFTLMMNYIAAYFIQYLREGPWRDPAKNGFPEMPRFAAAARLPSVLGVHAGWIFALAIALFVLIYLRYTKHGYELTVVGDNITTARYAGMPVNRIILRTMFISAGVCGLSGMIQASGANKMLTDSVAGGDGFTAIIVAWLARLSPVGILIVAVMFGVLKKGCASVETVYKISSEFFGILQGIILFFVLGVEFFITYRVQRKKEVK